MQLIRPELDAYLGGRFERLCREALPLIYLAEGVSTAFEVGPLPEHRRADGSRRGPASGRDALAGAAVSDQFTADGYDLLLAGHTHGGQLRIPLYGALVTNCGIDRERVRGLHLYPGGYRAPGEPNRPWLHVSAGLGTSPWAPVRFACRPEATLLTLVPRIS